MVFWVLGNVSASCLCYWPMTFVPSVFLEELDIVREANKTQFRVVKQE